MPGAHQSKHRTEEELRARDELMRLQFERDADAWENAVPAEVVLKKLEAKMQEAKPKTAK